MASNDFWLYLEQGLANYSSAYGLKLVSPWVKKDKNSFHIFKGVQEKRKNNKKEKYVTRDPMRPTKLDLLPGSLPKSLLNPDLEEQDLIKLN